jgi:hypothetical protein
MLDKHGSHQPIDNGNSRRSRNDILDPLWKCDLVALNPVGTNRRSLSGIQRTELNPREVSVSGQFTAKSV